MTHPASPLFPEIATTDPVPKVHVAYRDVFPMPPADEDGPRPINAFLEGKIGGRLIPKLLKWPFAEGLPVASVEEAEDTVLGWVNDGNTREFDTGDTSVALNLVLFRAANVIAARTRRAPGNLAFMHPSTVELLGDGWKATSDENPRVGRWTCAGDIGNCILVYTSEHMPEDLINVVYVGSTHDAPAVLAEQDGKLALVGHETVADAMGNGYDYVQAIRIKRA